MKLPENKKERTQIIVLLVIVAALAGYGLFLGVSRALMAPRRERRARIAVLERQIREARPVVNHARGDEQRNREILEQIREYSKRHLLEPQLGGNLLLGATEQVQTWFQSAGLPMPTIAEHGGRSGRSAIEPARGGDPVRDLVWSYSVRLAFKAGLHDIANVLRAIETSDPFVTVTALTVSADRRPTTDALPQHDVSFVVQWPIWRDDDFRKELESITP